MEDKVADMKKSLMDSRYGGSWWKCDMVNMMVRFKYSIVLVVEEIIKEYIFTEICFLSDPSPIIGNACHSLTH